MLARRHRFHGHGSLRSTYTKGGSVHASHIKLLYVPDRKLRVAVVVSKKVHKSAVVRNRIRRRVYAYIESLDPQPTADLVFVVKDAALALMPAAEVQQELSRLIAKVQ